MQSGIAGTGIPAYSLDHICLSVKDIYKTREFLSSVLGLGPWYVPFDYSPGKEEMTVGEPFSIRSTGTKIGAVELHLVQLLDPGAEGEDSDRAKWIRIHGEGLHHICLAPSKCGEIVSRLRKQPGMRMTAGGREFDTDWSYFEVDAGGMLIEFQDPGQHDSLYENLEGFDSIASGIAGTGMPLFFLHHISYAVKDVDRTREFLSSVLGLGPWLQFQYTPTKEEVAVGKRFGVKVAGAKIGAVELHLVQDLSEDSDRAQWIRTYGEGFHHIGFTLPRCSEIASRVQKQPGIIVLGSGGKPGKEWFYFTSNPGGMVFELQDPGSHNEDWDRVPLKV